MWWCSPAPGRGGAGGEGGRGAGGRRPLVLRLRPSHEDLPFSQARRNRYALADKLAQRLHGWARCPGTAHAHTRSVVSRGGVARLPCRALEALRAFLLDRTARLARRGFAQAVAGCRPATPGLDAQPAAGVARVAGPLIATCWCPRPVRGRCRGRLVPSHAAATAAGMLRSQPRLLVEGGAGTGSSAGLHPGPRARGARQTGAADLLQQGAVDGRRTARCAGGGGDALSRAGPQHVGGGGAEAAKRKFSGALQYDAAFDSSSAQTLSLLGPNCATPCGAP